LWGLNVFHCSKIFSKFHISESLKFTHLSLLMIMQLRAALGLSLFRSYNYTHFTVGGPEAKQFTELAYSSPKDLN
jgi:hypothetical protein